MGLKSTLKFDEAVKVKNQTVSKKVQFTARKSQRREAYLCTPQRLRGAAQRRKWTFCGTVKFENQTGDGEGKPWRI
jgi:hypothetical protein